MSPRNNAKPGVISGTFGDDKFADALRTMAEVTSKPNVTKNHTVDIEGAVDTVFMAVDALASLHPAVSAIKVPLIIIKNCAINRENRSRIALMKLKMAEMLCALFEIRFIEVDEEIVKDIGPGQDGRFSGALTLLCKEISNTLVKVGNLIERYAKEGSLRRVIWANDWKQQIKDCCDECDRNKQSIGYRIKVFTAKQVLDISQTLSQIKVSTDVISKQFDPTQQKERQLYDEIKKRGLEGRLDRLTDEELIELANKADESGGNRPNTQELRTYRMSVKELLDSSLRGFEIRLDMHTKQLDRALYHLKRLPTDARHYQRIEDPDIRKLWREWKWAGSVEASTFTLNLYDYFVDLTREARREAVLSQSAMRPGDLALQTTLVVHPSPMSPVSDAGGEELGDEQCTTGSDALEDYWCTRYFSYRNMSIFMEAMDADGNGLIKIKEVNEFTRAKPPSLSLMEWIAYRSYGWLIASYLYKLRIQYLIEIMLAIDYAPENCSAVAGYFIRMPHILNLLSTIQDPVLEDASLVKVVHTVMSYQEKQLEDVLDTLKYNVTEDGITLLSSVNGAEGFEMGSELESFLLPVLFLLLFRHYELVKLSAKYVLNEDEIGRNANISIGVIMEAVADRVKSLADHFRKMQLDVRQKFESFANGMYQGFYRVQTSNMSFTQIQDEATVPQNTLPWLNYLLRSYDCQDNKLFTQLDTSRYALHPEFAHLGRLPIFDTVASAQGHDGDCLRHDDYVSLVHLRERYGVEFVRSWNPEADVERPRPSLTSVNVSHEYVGCDGCGSAVTGIRYKCVQCPNFDYCDTCHADPPPIPQDNPTLALHNATHDFLALNQDAPTPILDMMRRGLESHERPVVIALLTCNISEAKENAADLVAFIHFCSSYADDDRTEAVQRAEAFLDGLGEEGQSCKDSLLYLKLYRNTQGHYASCDGCKGNIQGNRFECIDCFDFDFCQECYDSRASRVENIGQHEATHRFAIVRYPIPWMFIRRLLTYVAAKDLWTTDRLREWRDNLQFFRSMQTASDSSEGGYEVRDEEDASTLDEPGPHQTRDEEDASGLVTEDHELDNEAPTDETATEPGELSSTVEGEPAVKEESQHEDPTAHVTSEREEDNEEHDDDFSNGVRDTEMQSQDIPSGEGEVSNQLVQVNASLEIKICDGTCERPIAGDMYCCLLCTDCILCSDCALSDSPIEKFNPPHRSIHVMQIIPMAPSADEGTNAEVIRQEEFSTLEAHVACTPADFARLEARLDRMEEKLNDNTARMTGLISSITELLARLGSSSESP